MLIVLLSIVASGVVALGVWLWCRKAVPIQSSTENHLRDATPQPEMDMAEKAASPGESADDGTQGASQDQHGERIFAQNESNAKISTREEDEQEPSSTAVEDEHAVSAIEAAPEDHPEGGSEAVQTSNSIADNLNKRSRDDRRRRSGADTEEPNKKPFMQDQTDAKVKESADETATDESVAARCRHANPKELTDDPNARRTSGAQWSTGTGVVAEGERSREGSETLETAASTSQTMPIQEKALGTQARTDSKTDDNSEVEDIPEDAPRGDEDHPGRTSANEQNSGDSERAETDAPASHELPNRDENIGTGVCADSEAEEKSNGKEVVTSAAEMARPAIRERRPPAVHRDRRGLGRTGGQTSECNVSGPSPPAEVRLRLLLDPLQRSASLSVVLMRPEGYPERIVLDGEGPVDAFDTSRYDDLAVEWTGELLSGELRIGSEGRQWLRAARPVHLFAESPAEPGMISVGYARPDVPHAVICTADDEEAVRAAAVSTGSPDLVSHERWHGIPVGWAVLSGYRPRHGATEALPTQLSPLDPGTEVEISLSGGLAIRATVYAEGKPPRIRIAPLPNGASVMIGGIPAKQAHDGAWEAEGWDSPGHHLVDVVPGPSLTYQIMGDAVANGEWQFWDAHPERFGTGSHEPWGRAEICGAAVRGPEGETVIAAASLPVLIALGEREQAVPLMPRDDVPASVAMLLRLSK